MIYGNGVSFSLYLLLSHDNYHWHIVRYYFVVVFIAKSDIYYFETYVVALWNVLVGASVFRISSSYKSLFCRCTKTCVVWNSILLNSLLRPFGCSVSRPRIQKYSLMSNRFWIVNLSRFVWLSCSISINFEYILKLCLSMSKWFHDGILSVMVTSFLWWLSLILKLVCHSQRIATDILTF